MKTRLLEEKAKVLEAIGKAVQQGISREIIIASQKLERIEDLISRCENLQSEISSLEKENGVLRLPTTGKEGSTWTDLKSVPGRGIGKKIRLDFLNKLSEAGINLRQIKGAIFKTESGKKAGIAVATERKSNRWFLGLPAGGFDHAVLLCKKNAGAVIEICLPKEFFDEFGHMSESRGQVMFNIFHERGDYLISIPGKGRASVTKYLNGHSILK